VELHEDNYVDVSIWTTSAAEGPTKIQYPKARLISMGTESMPHHDVFRTAESLSSQERQAFWCGEGGDHMIRFNKGEQHQCHLLFVMWHDFQQLDSSNQKACRDVYIRRTYDCLSKAGNSTRVTRQLQAFAHFVCDGGDMYIEPSKFIQCNGEVISQRPLFKKLVQKVLERVRQSEKEHKVAEEKVARSRAVAPSTRVVKNASISKPPVTQILAVSIPLCEAVAKEVLAEHPLISRVVSAEVKEGLPLYSIEIQGEASSTSEGDAGYSYDALALRQGNVALLDAYNRKWKQDVTRIGDSIDPITKERTPTVTWKRGSQVTEVSRRFFERVGWMDYYELVRSSSTDDDDEFKSAPFTPVRSTASPHPRSSSRWSQSSSTPTTPAEKTVQELHEVVDNAASKGMSEARLRALLDQVLQAINQLPSSAAEETDKGTGSEMEDDGEVGSPIDGGEEKEVEQGDGNDAQDKDEDEGRMDEDDVEEEEDDPSPRRSKRKAASRLSIGRKKQAHK
jgi:hypothetical protein